MHLFPPFGEYYMLLLLIVGSGNICALQFTLNACFETRTQG